MERRALLSVLIMVGMVLVPALAAAQSPDEAAAASMEEGSWLMRPAIGARIGGYGFRQVDEEGDLSWQGCRMDGVGVFGSLDLTRRFYVELSVDMYHAISEPIEQGLDRLSMHSAAAVGVRLAPDLIISPFIQIGGGAEWTRVEVYGERDSSVVPVGFMGVGGEINLDPVMLGLTIRANAMQLPVYEWGAADEASRSVQYETEVAGQMLFSVRYAM